jgi:hypothetical protein
MKPRPKVRVRITASLVNNFLVGVRTSANASSGYLCLDRRLLRIAWTGGFDSEKATACQVAYSAARRRELKFKSSPEMGRPECDLLGMILASLLGLIYRFRHF